MEYTLYLKELLSAGRALRHVLAHPVVSLIGVYAGLDLHTSFRLQI